MERTCGVAQVQSGWMPYFFESARMVVTIEQLVALEAKVSSMYILSSDERQGVCRSLEDNLDR
jgi:hypothetical protein